MSCRALLATAMMGCLAVAAVAGQEAANDTEASPARGGARVPGARTAAGILASGMDGMSRYLAADGPIQPALTAIGGAPLRGIELANNGISRISNGFDSAARRLSSSAGNEASEPIRMPGMEALESSMPASIASLGTRLHGAIQQKNKFIMGQAEKGIQAGERLRSKMQNSLQGLTARSSNHMGMMAGGAEAMMKGSQTIKYQLQESLNGKMSRMMGVMSMGGDMRNQAQGIGKTLANGLQGAMSQLSSTKQQVGEQLRGNLQQNVGKISNLVSSMQGSMGSMGQNMQKNFSGVVRHAQRAAQQVTEQLQQAVTKPMELIRSLGDGFSKMASSHSQQGGRQGGRY